MSWILRITLAILELFFGIGLMGGKYNMAEGGDAWPQP